MLLVVEKQHVLFMSWYMLNWINTLVVHVVKKQNCIHGDKVQLEHVHVCQPFSSPVELVHLFVASCQTGTMWCFIIYHSTQTTIYYKQHWSLWVYLLSSAGPLSSLSNPRRGGVSKGGVTFPRALRWANPNKINSSSRVTYWVCNLDTWSSSMWVPQKHP